MNIQSFLQLFSYVLPVCLTIGGLLAIRKGRTQEVANAQNELLKTLKDEIAALRRRVDDLVAERATQDRVITTIRQALKDRGLRVTIAGDFVTIKDSKGQTTTKSIQQGAVRLAHNDEDDETAS